MNFQRGKRHEELEMNLVPLIDVLLVAGISAALQAAVNGSKEEPTIIINADAKTTHQSVIDVMEASRTAGYTHITFATQSKAGS